MVKLLWWKIDSGSQLVKHVGWGVLCHVALLVLLAGCCITEVSCSSLILLTVMSRCVLMRMCCGMLCLLWLTLICSCEVIKDQKTGNSLQYAFIEFETVCVCLSVITPSIGCTVLYELSCGFYCTTRHPLSSFQLLIAACWWSIGISWWVGLDIHGGGNSLPSLRSPPH